MEEPEIEKPKMRAGSTIRRMWHRIIPELMRGDSVESVAEKLDISPDTLYRVMKNPWFVQKFEQAQFESVGFALVNINRASLAAVREIERIATDRETPASIRLAAGIKIVEWAMKNAERKMLERRLERLEQELHGTENEQKAIGDGEDEEYDGEDEEEESED